MELAGCDHCQETTDGGSEFPLDCPSEGGEGETDQQTQDCSYCGMETWVALNGDMGSMEWRHG